MGVWASEASTFYYQLHELQGDESGSLESLMSAANDIAVLGIIIFSTLIALLTLSAIREAKITCREEQAKVAAEAKAFEAFAAGVDELVSTRPSKIASPVSTQGSGKIGSDKILDIYRDTMMNLDHYEEEYGKPAIQDIAAEFGPEMATAINTNQSLAHPVKQRLTFHARKSAQDREELHSAIDEELRQLDCAVNKLSRIDHQRAEIFALVIDESTAEVDQIDCWQKLFNLEERCEEVIDWRQTAIKDPPMTHQRSGPNFYEFLYDELPAATYPVLHDALRLIDSIRNVRKRSFEY